MGRLIQYQARLKPGGRRLGAGIASVLGLGDQGALRVKNLFLGGTAQHIDNSRLNCTTLAQRMHNSRTILREDRRFLPPPWVARLQCSQGDLALGGQRLLVKAAEGHGASGRRRLVEFALCRLAERWLRGA